MHMHMNDLNTFTILRAKTLDPANYFKVIMITYSSLIKMHMRSNGIS